MSNEIESLERETVRESFWSIDRKDRLNFSFWFSLVFLVGFGLLCWYHIFHQNKGCTLIAFISIAKAFVPTGLIAFTLTFLRFEIRNAIKYINLVSERRSTRRRNEGRQEVLDWLAENYPDISPPPHLNE